MVKGNDMVAPSPTSASSPRDESPSSLERPELRPLGAWRRSSLVTPELAVGLEQLGYSTLWLGAADGDLALVDELLEATTSLTIATGIVNIWRDEPRAVADAFHRVRDRHGERFVLGIGVGHPEATGGRYRYPYRALVEYLDVLDDVGVPIGGRMLAALGPRVLRLSAERSAGAHPYLVTPEYTRQARGILGVGPLLVPDHKVVLRTDSDQARAIARPVLAPYLGMINYRNSLTSIGFGEEDLADGGSDRLVDAVYAWGTAATVVARLKQHVASGADQVAVNLIAGRDDDPLDGFRAIAAAWQATD
jgi:probable F420-dependent oxidoreductase